MIGNTGKPVIFRDLAQMVLPVVLLDGLHVPVHQDLVKMPGYGRGLDTLIIRRAHPDVGYLVHKICFCALMELGRCYEVIT